jgi:hypothetical protein
MFLGMASRSRACDDGGGKKAERRPLPLATALRSLHNTIHFNSVAVPGSLAPGKLLTQCTFHHMQGLELEFNIFPC